MLRIERVEDFHIEKLWGRSFSEELLPEILSKIRS
jgi:hypothetical protein